MILSEPPPSPFDLRWRMFGIGVRVNWMFWVVSVMMTWGIGVSYGVVYLPLSVLAVFVSILIHEMGHVLVFRVFGCRSHIVLYGFGGLAVPNDWPRARWKRILVSFAGPGAQFILVGVIIAIILVLWETGARGAEGKYTLMYFLPLDGATPRGVVAVFDLLLYVNFFWALVNLLPIWPLDGGMISRQLFEGARPRDGTVLSLQLSMAVAGLLAIIAGVNMWLERVGDGGPFQHIPILGSLDLFHLIFFGYFAYTSWQAYQQERTRQRYYDEFDDNYR